MSLPSGLTMGEFCDYLECQKILCHAPLKKYAKWAKWSSLMTSHVILCQVVEFTLLYTVLFQIEEHALIGSL